MILRNYNVILVLKYIWLLLWVIKKHVPAIINLRTIILYCHLYKNVVFVQSPYLALEFTEKSLQPVTISND